ncbi:MAG TPA: transposase [Dissulfurispiraceae bacterium]|nr:transposase [Dissulfurispiraceae bacterium]
MIDAFDGLFAMTRPAFSQERTYERARRLAISSLVGLGRKTITGMLCAGSQQFEDWTASYRLFERERFDKKALFEPVRRTVLEHLPSQEPIVAIMDDTLVHKRGRKISGTSWRRDPLGPPFCTNFIWGQRFLQVSAALPEHGALGGARGIPIDLVHAPSPRKPRKNASPELWDIYRQEQKQTKISAIGKQRFHAMRAWLDNEQYGIERKLIVAVDGGYTNREMMRNIPHDTIVIGRIRKDAKIYNSPKQIAHGRKGRPRWYGDALPTPEQLRQDQSIAWIPVSAHGAGKIHVFEVKTIDVVRWLGTGDKDVRIVIVRPLAYRPHKGAHLLYRDPAYLICTDPTLPLDRLLQAYLWRWEIELNFRDEKTLLGMGQAQVRTEAAVEAVPSLIVATYAFMLLAALRSSMQSQLLPLPKWRNCHAEERPSTSRIINVMRSQLWGRAMSRNLPHFVSDIHHDINRVKIDNPALIAACYSSQ